MEDGTLFGLWQHWSVVTEEHCTVILLIKLSDVGYELEGNRFSTMIIFMESTISLSKIS